MPIRQLREAALVFGLTLALGACGGEPISNDPGLLQEAQTLRADGQIPALVLAEFSCEAEKLAWAGQLKIGQSEGFSSEARFNIGSNAKSFLAAAAARMQERGELNLHDPLKKLWPEAAAANPDKAEITLAQLFSHASGLPAFSSGGELNGVPELTPATEATALWFLEQPLVAEPGSAVLYSNAGYVVAGAILEQVTGKSYEAIIHDEIFGPLGLQAKFGEPRALGTREPFGHYQGEAGVVAYEEAEPPLPPFLLAAGNIAISMPDYLTYLRENLCAHQGKGTDLLSSETARLIHTPTLEGGSGLGWGMFELDGTETSFHIGGTGDFTAYAIMAPEKNFGVAALLNVGGAPAAPVQAWMVGKMSNKE